MPFPTPEDLPDPGIKPMPLASPSLVGGFFTTVPPGKPYIYIYVNIYIVCMYKNIYNAYSYIYWASLVAQTVKNWPAMQETLVQSLQGGEDPLEKGMATHSSILVRRILICVCVCACVCVC